MSESPAVTAPSVPAATPAAPKSAAPQKPGPAQPGSGKAAKAKPAPDTRTPAQIEAQMVVTRQRLAERIDEVSAYVAPKAVAGRQVQKVKAFYVDEYGGIRPERVLVTAAVVAAVVGLRLLRRRRRH